MAGHSAWKNIKHKKAAADKKRGKVWSKCSRAILSAAKQGGGDPKFNATLRYAVDEAKAANMPKDTIEKLIKKATGADSDAATFTHVRYEGYAPGGVAVIVDCLTDNVQRTAPVMRLIFEKAGGNLAKPGAVAFGFAQKGLILIEAGKATEDQLVEIALEAGAEDVRSSEGGWEITTEPAQFLAVKEALERASIPLVSAEILLHPNSTIAVDAATASKVLRLVEALEEEDDVQKVYTNAELPDEVLA
jgi:YebC/PmpR family DNA-binding regulatory protein